MKRSLFVILLALMLLGLSACGSSGSNDFFVGASPATSALTFYVYEGGDEPVQSYHMYNGATTRDILNRLETTAAKAAPDWTPAEVNGPVYGFNIGKEDGWGICAAWCNGFWIRDDGSAYAFDFDFAALLDDYAWEEGHRFSSRTVMPCQRWLSQDQNGWYPSVLQPCTPLDPPESITLDIYGADRENVRIRLSNTGGEEWMFGEYYALHVLVEGMWYEVPEIPGNWGFNDIGLILPAGESVEKSYRLTMYGQLPPGHYRLVVEGLSGEFDLA